MSTTATRVLFRTAAIFNWIAAVIFIAPLGIARALGLEPLLGGDVYEQIAIVAIALFGLGYWWVARDPVANRSIIALGIIGKLGVVTVVWLALWRGDANLRLALLASGDLVYAALFAWYLRGSRVARP